MSLDATSSRFDKHNAPETVIIKALQSLVESDNGQDVILGIMTYLIGGWHSYSFRWIFSRKISIWSKTDCFLQSDAVHLKQIIVQNNTYRYVTYNSHIAYWLSFDVL